MPDLPDAFGDGDPQDGAEVLDETNYDDREENNRMRTLDELPDVLDVTRAAGDRDDDEALALDADEFDAEAFDDGDLEEDDELDYRASDEEHEDDLDGLGPEDGYNEDELDTEEVEGLEETVMDADGVSGGEDDFTNFQSKGLSDEDLQRMGYSRDGKARS
jgi:hypothetical protein